jgi:hypothetical protein
MTCAGSTICGVVFAKRNGICEFSFAPCRSLAEKAATTRPTARSATLRNACIFPQEFAPGD